MALIIKPGLLRIFISTHILPTIFSKCESQCEKNSSHIVTHNIRWHWNYFHNQFNFDNYFLTKKTFLLFSHCDSHFEKIVRILLQFLSHNVRNKRNIYGQQISHLKDQLHKCTHHHVTIKIFRNWAWVKIEWEESLEDL